MATVKVLSLSALGNVEEINLNTGTGGGGLSLTNIEVNLGSIPLRSGKFSITTTGLVGNKPVIITQGIAPYTEKGTLSDETEMDFISLIGFSTSTTNIDCYWSSETFVKGNFKFNYTETV